MTALSTPPVRAGMTAAELAARTRMPPQFVEAILEDERDRGHVEIAAGCWRLTPTGERAIGAALRALAERGIR